MIPRKEWCEYMQYLPIEAQVEVLSYISAYPEGKPKLNNDHAKAFVAVIKPVMDLECGSKPKRVNFKKPTYDEVYDYFTEHYKGKYFDFDPQAFIDFYESKGWMVGKSPMKNWHSAINTWKKGKPTLSDGEWMMRYGKSQKTTSFLPQLGEDEFIKDGQRRYYHRDGRLSSVVVPMDAPKRPNKLYEYSTSQNNWYFQA